MFSLVWPCCFLEVWQPWNTAPRHCFRQGLLFEQKIFFPKMTQIRLPRLGLAGHLVPHVYFAVAFEALLFDAVFVQGQWPKFRKLEHNPGPCVWRTGLCFWTSIFYLPFNSSACTHPIGTDNVWDPSHNAQISLLNKNEYSSKLKKRDIWVISLHFWWQVDESYWNVLGCAALNMWTNHFLTLFVGYDSSYDRSDPDQHRHHHRPSFQGF